MGTKYTIKMRETLGDLSEDEIKDQRNKIKNGELVIHHLVDDIDEIQDHYSHIFFSDYYVNSHTHNLPENSNIFGELSLCKPGYMRIFEDFVNNTLLNMSHRDFKRLLLNRPFPLFDTHGTKCIIIERPDDNYQMLILESDNDWSDVVKQMEVYEFTVE